MVQHVLTVEQMRVADQLAIAGGIAGLTLMENAGRAVADHAGTMVPPGASIAVVCGPGNNGGDGLVAARLLRQRGFGVDVTLSCPRSALRGDASLAAAQWTGPVREAADFAPDGADLIVDALFGTGLSRPPGGMAASLINRINVSGRPVLAVDLPSGLDGDTGRPSDPAVRATATITFFRLKPCHLLVPGRQLCGDVTISDIGIPVDVAITPAPCLWRNTPELWQARLPPEDMETHKYRRGACLVWSGPTLGTGASRLAAVAALRAGAGIVRIAGPREALLVHAAHVTSIMLREAGDAAGFALALEDRRIGAVVVGPAAGVGPLTQEIVSAALAAGRNCVLDADALTSFAGQADTLSGKIRDRPRDVVLTPHEGEYLELFGPGNPEASKVERARDAARLTGAVVVLKGPDTVIAAPDGRAAINDNAPPWLATAGSGDVLAGLIGGLLAQGVPGFEAAAAGVWWHGAIGQHAGRGLIAEDLIEALRYVRI
jgi:ADP-dependent NAD(P)H-hydrate dehydratase / NAD(P)H-hydrate epimerase